MSHPLCNQCNQFHLCLFLMPQVCSFLSFPDCGILLSTLLNSELRTWTLDLQQVAITPHLCSETTEVLHLLPIIFPWKSLTLLLFALPNQPTVNPGSQFLPLTNIICCSSLNQSPLHLIFFDTPNHQHYRIHDLL